MLVSRVWCHREGVQRHSGAGEEGKPNVDPSKAAVIPDSSAKPTNGDWGCTWGMGEERCWGWWGGRPMWPGRPPLPERARSRSMLLPGCPAAPEPPLDGCASTILGTTACGGSRVGRTYCGDAATCCAHSHRRSQCAPRHTTLPSVDCYSKTGRT